MSLTANDSKSAPAAFSFGPALSFPAGSATDTLIDAIVFGHKLWAVWERRRGVQLKYWPLTTQSLSSSTSSGSSGWIDIMTAQNVRDTSFASEDEPRPIAVAPDVWYLERIFLRHRFSLSLLTNAVERLAHKLGLFPTPMLLQSAPGGVSGRIDYGEGNGPQQSEVRKEVIQVVTRQIEAAVRARDLRAEQSDADRAQIESIAEQHWREFLLLVRITTASLHVFNTMIYIESADRLTCCIVLC